MPIKDLREEINKTHRPIIISDDSDGNTNEFKCKYCHRIIRSKFTEDSIWCNSCQSETIIDKDTKPVKKSLKAEVIDNSEVFVATTPDPVSQFDKKPVELQGGFKALSQRGTIRFTSYQEYYPQGQGGQGQGQGQSPSSSQSQGRRVPGPTKTTKGDDNKTD
jgi:DNA-directed RNA polymerase subunit RPC12/RpoP